jgi:hypothetical protein
MLDRSSLNSGEKEHDHALKGVGVLCVRLSFRNRGRSSADLKIEGSVSVVLARRKKRHMRYSPIPTQRRYRSWSSTRFRT